MRYLIWISYDTKVENLIQVLRSKWLAIWLFKYYLIFQWYYPLGISHVLFLCLPYSTTTKDLRFKTLDCRFEHEGESPGGFIKNRLLSLSEFLIQYVWVRLQNLHFQRVSECYCCCCSRDHALKIIDEE